MPLPPLVEPGPPLTAAQSATYSRHLLLPEIGEIGQRRLLNARVGVMGAGGLGSPVLLYLAAAGVGTLGIIDDDVVEPSNLQRQIIHTAADLDRPKAESAADAVHRLAPYARVRVHPERLTPTTAQEVLAGYDLIIDGTDNFDTRYLVADTCDVLGLPLIWASILRFDAQISLFWGNPHEGTSPVGLRDVFPDQPTDGESCSTAGVLGALCGQVGSIMASEAVKLIVGAGRPLLGRLLVVDALSSSVSEVPIRRADEQMADTDRQAGAVPVVTASSRTARVGATEAGGGASDAHPAAPPVTIRRTGRAERMPSAGQAPGRYLITAADLARRLSGRASGDDDFTLLDVREQSERDRSAIPGSVHIPLAECLTEEGRAKLDSSLPVVVYCAHGPRATTAVRDLLAHGFGSALVLEGGMAEWPYDAE